MCRHPAHLTQNRNSLIVWASSSPHRIHPTREQPQPGGSSACRALAPSCSTAPPARARVRTRRRALRCTVITVQHIRLPVLLGGPPFTAPCSFSWEPAYKGYGASGGTYCTVVQTQACLSANHRGVTNPFQVPRYSTYTRWLAGATLYTFPTWAAGPSPFQPLHAFNFAAIVSTQTLLLFPSLPCTLTHLLRMILPNRSIAVVASCFQTTLQPDTTRPGSRRSLTHNILCSCRQLTFLPSSSLLGSEEGPRPQS